VRAWLGAFLFLLIAPSAFADDRDQVIGTWQLDSVVYEDPATGERTHPLGEHPTGLQIATPQGEWLALVTAEGRPVPSNDAERAAALRSMISYTGKWHLDGDHVVTHVAAAWNQAWVDTDQVRFWKREGDLLLLSSPPQPHPNLLGKMVKIIVIWKKLY
jgi:hypothetical protein